MSTQDAILKEALAGISATLAENLRNTISEALERQISETLTHSLLESEFYRRISKDMRSGLKKIYKEISTAASSTPNMQKEDADKLFTDASEQLAEVLATTEKATFSILEVIERNFDLQEESAGIIEAIRQNTASPEQIERLAELNALLGDDLTEVMTTLSFQDLTGQRIKRVVAAMKQIESTVVEMYLSTGLLIKGREEKPDRDLAELTKEAEDAVSGYKNSVLQGPSQVSQDSIDDLLAQLGM